MNTFRKLTHIGVCVSDMERSKQLYCDVLGFRYLRELHVEGEPGDTLLRLRDVTVHAVYIERDGFELELLHYASPRSPKPVPAHAMNDLGFTHLSIQVPNLEEAMAALEAAGVEVIRSTFIKRCRCSRVREGPGRAPDRAGARATGTRRMTLPNFRAPGPNDTTT